MSWTNELFQVYEKNCGRTDEKPFLLPISHSTANAQIEITISEEGEFLDVRAITDKADAITIIPVTEDSGTRSSGITPHPLMDKLIYIAGDYPEFVLGKNADNTEYHRAYLQLLKSWFDSIYVHPAVKAIYRYVCKEAILKDLINAGILLVDKGTGKLDEKHKIMGIAQADCFVRFRVEYKDYMHSISEIWKDPDLYQSYIDFQSTLSGNTQLCYATGKILPCTYKHPSKIRHSGDKAKLISSNDESGFSYRGRFFSKEQALSVSYDFSQKMHNALKWLREKQGISIGSMILIMWESALKPLPDLLAEPRNTEKESILMSNEDDPDMNSIPEQSDEADTLPMYRKWLRDYIWGYRQDLDENSKAMIMLLDAATTGRLSVSMYEEMSSSELLQNMIAWHENIAWMKYQWKEKKYTVRSFSLYEIADYTFGTEQGENIECKKEIRNQTMLRLIPCILKGQDIPTDIVDNIIYKASNPMAYKHKYNRWKVLETACGLIRKKIIEKQKKSGKKEECDVSLNRERNDRDYLYGRLLAIAEAAEASYYEKDEARTTNASRLFEVFSKRPYQSWVILHNRLLPYLNRMKPGSKIFYTKLLCEVEDLFDDDDYKNDAKLLPDYLLGYYCQLKDIYTKKEKPEEVKSEEETDERVIQKN